MRNIALLALLLPCTASPGVAADPTCLVPFSLVDRWADADGDGRYDAGEVYDPSGTGFIAPDDTGLALVLGAANPQSPVSLDTYFLIAYPPLDQGTPLTGEAWLRKWASECAPYAVTAGDSLLVEPGNLFDALLEELDALIASDPGAYWDEASGTVQGSAFAVSPRLVSTPCFDPTAPPTSGANQVRATKVALLFLESTAGPGTIQARFVGDSGAPTAVERMSWGRIKSRW